MTSHSPSTSSRLEASKKEPALIVFDLDNTLWTPELFQLRRIQRQNRTPIAGKDVNLFPGAKAALKAIKSGKFPNTKFAIASRTNKVDWAQDLLDQFGIRELFEYIEIFPSSKRQHFKNIADASKIGYHEMLFFDDARGGRFGNCEPISNMGVLSVHCPGGLDTEEVFTRGLKRFEEWDGASNTIIEWDGSVSNAATDSSGGGPSGLRGTRQEGVVKMVNYDKRYGFIDYGSKNTKDIFFHFSKLPEGKVVERGDKLSFVVGRDPKNRKPVANDVEILSSSASGSEDVKDTVSIRAFSMNLPFAALMANGYKTLETRNGTMFVPYPEGTQMLLHVGQRIYPDGDKHLEVMKSGGLSDEEIRKLKSLPKGFGKGMIVAIMEIGRTYETTVEERSDPDVQRNVAAYGTDSGRMVTEIKRIQYLKKPVKASGQGGVYKVKIDPDLIPDDWELSAIDTGTGKLNNGAPTGSMKSGKPIYSISG